MNCRSARKHIADFAALKDPGAFGDMDFTEAEWAAAIRAAVTSRGEEKPGRFVPVFRPAFGYALGFLLVGAAVFFGVQRFPWLVPVVENRPVATAAIARKPDIVEPLYPERESVFADSNLRARAEGAVPPASRASLLPSPKPSQQAGDVPSLTWISQETGLQIVWFVNENLNLEE